MVAERAIEIRNGIEPGLVSRLTHPPSRVQQQSLRSFDARLRAILSERQSRLLPKQLAEIARTDMQALGQFADGQRPVGGLSQLCLNLLQQRRLLSGLLQQQLLAALRQILREHLQ